MSRIAVFLGLRDDLSLVQTAEQLGYESVWTAEGQGMTAFGKLERWATATTDIGLATGIVNVYSRTPAAVAQSIATLDAHADGRAILGLGVAHPGVVEGFHGSEFDRPLARIAEYIKLVRRYLAGDARSFDGEFFTPRRTSFWAGFEPVRSAVPIYNAALGRQNVQLTGELADGWLPNLYPAGQFDTALEWLAAGAERTDRAPGNVDVAMYVLTAIDEDPDRARDMVREHVVYYLREIPGYYDRAAREAGFGEQVDRILAANSTAAASDVVGDDFVESIALVGTPADVREQLAALREAGVDLPVVRAPSGADDAVVARTLETFAPMK